MNMRKDIDRRIPIVFLLGVSLLLLSSLAVPGSRGDWHDGGGSSTRSEDGKIAISAGGGNVELGIVEKDGTISFFFNAKTPAGDATVTFKLLGDGDRVIFELRDHEGSGTQQVDEQGNYHANFTTDGNESTDVDYVFDMNKPGMTWEVGCCLILPFLAIVGLFSAIIYQVRRDKTAKRKMQQKQHLDPNPSDTNSPGTCSGPSPPTSPPIGRP